MKLLRSSFRPCLEHLERRLVPANLTASFSPVTHTLTVLGDAQDNAVTIKGDAGDRTHFTLSSSTGTINNSHAAFSSPSGVKNLAIQLLDGTDSVIFDNTVHIDLLGTLAINGGNGANSVAGSDLTVEKSVVITNGTNTTGTDQFELNNLSIKGSLTINNGNGQSFTQIQRSSAGISSIVGNLSITNGTGKDEFYLVDTNVGGSVTINNGHGGSGVAGRIDIFNALNTAYRSLIGGNLTVTYLDGDVLSHDGLFDLEVMGNVTLNHGSGAFGTSIDGYQTTLPVLIHGNLTITGTGANSINIGSLFLNTGLIVGKNFTVTTGSGADSLAVNKLQVYGISKWSLGDGANSVTIDDSLFGGTFTLLTGAGNDTFNLEMTAGSSSLTVFDKAVVLSFGNGSDTGQIAFQHHDANQGIVAYSTFVVLRGWDSWGQDPGQEFFPLGGFVHLM
jgi:hypothetical protein